MANKTVWITYVVASVVVVLFGLGACLMAWRRRRRYGPETSEFFLTARGSSGAFRIAWSFYAAAMGSWTLFSPASYATTAGYLGLIFYSVSTGLPILIQGYIGPLVQKRMPNVLSMSDYARMRFGRVFQVWVSAIMLLSMGVVMTAEYTAVGNVFEFIIGTDRIPIVIIIGVTSMLYTAYGGLYVSIITDQWQAGLSLLLLGVLVVYVGVTFREPLPRPLPDSLGINYYGWSSTAVMPISLISSSVFSEAVWQRCWAAKDARSLRLGALFGSIQVTIAVFLFGFGGFLAYWGGLFSYESDPSGNTILFSILNAGGSGTVWITVLVCVLSTTMSEAAIDSLQNAIVDNIAVLLMSFFPAMKRAAPLLVIRFLVLVLNVPVIVVSLQNYNILQLFLLANLVATTSTLPMLLGLVQTPAAKRHITGFTSLFGCLFSFASLFVYGRIRTGAGDAWGTTYADALNNLFFVSSYDWPPFVIALGFSLVGMAIGIVLQALIRLVWPNAFVHRTTSDGPPLTVSQNAVPSYNGYTLPPGNSYAGTYPPSYKDFKQSKYVPSSQPVNGVEVTRLKNDSL